MTVWAVDNSPQTPLRVLRVPSRLHVSDAVQHLFASSRPALSTGRGESAMGCGSEVHSNDIVRARPRREEITYQAIPTNPKETR